ncbi:MAG: glycosyltransferase family 2 protein [Dorea sp.]|nr:glycosyltransferase family 2 protein [Dorea sp.]
MCNVSIIVPIYHGQKYIPSIIRQVEDCNKCADEKINIELLLVNDAPDCPLPPGYSSRYIDIVALNTETNRGTQGARVRGAECSRGSFLLFLDQDDKIAPEYLKSQIEKIEGCDAVVCRALHEKKPFYNHTRPFAESICKKYILGEENPIISPGQVLIKREAVSEIWKENILKNNGADDWLLWLCMMEEGKSFALNDEILFEHVVEGDNGSLRIEEMQRSEQEVLEVIRRSPAFSVEDADVLAGTIQNLTMRRLKLLGKFQRMSCIYDRWLSLKNKGICIAGCLRKKGYRTIAVYGVTSLGERLCQELETDKMGVSYFIDRNALFFDNGIKVCSPEEELCQVDVVIISLVQDEQQISDLLKTKLPADIWTIAELLDRAEQETLQETGKSMK